MSAPNIPTNNPARPSLIKLGASLMYDALVTISLSFACALLFLVVLGDATHGLKRYLLQLFLWLAVGVYFVRCWSRSGQTLAMQTWRIQLLDSTQALPSVRACALRYVLASLSLSLLGLGFLWAIVDRDGRYLHDRILKLGIYSLPKS